MLHYEMYCSLQQSGRKCREPGTKSVLFYSKSEIRLFHPFLSFGSNIVTFIVPLMKFKGDSERLALALAPWDLLP